MTGPICPPATMLSTSYKLEWTRWQQERVTRYLAWPALVRKSGRSDQFLTHNFGA